MPSKKLNVFIVIKKQKSVKIIENDPKDITINTWKISYISEY